MNAGREAQMPSTNRKLNWTSIEQTCTRGLGSAGSSNVAAICLLTIGQLTITDRRPAMDVGKRQLDLVSNLS